MTVINASGTVGRSNMSVSVDAPDEDDEIRLGINDYGPSAEVYLSRDEARRIAYELLRVAGGESTTDLVPRDLIEQVARETAEVANIAREHAGREVRRKFRAVINE
jgi:hypothetical protein